MDDRTEPTSAKRKFVGAHDIIVLVAATTLLTASEWFLDDWLGAAPYFLALLVLSLMDVRLPHGDTVDVDSPVIIAGLYLFGPAVTAVSVVGARLVTHLLVQRRGSDWSTLAAIAKRFVGIGAGYAGLLLMPEVSWQRLHPFVDVLVIGLGYTFVSLVYAQVALALERRDSVVRMAVSNLVLQGPVLAASVSVGILTVLIHDNMSVWGLVLVLLLATTMRQSFALLLDIRQGYHSTVEALVGAMEAQRVHDRGAGRRVSVLARTAAAEYGWFGNWVENIGYAALLVHFRLAFVSRDTETGETRPTPLADVRFLRPVAPIVEVAQAPETAAVDSRRTLIAAYIVLLSVREISPDQVDRALGSLSGRLAPRERWRSEDAVQRASRKLGFS